MSGPAYQLFLLISVSISYFNFDKFHLAVLRKRASGNFYIYTYILYKCIYKYIIYIYISYTSKTHPNSIAVLYM